MAVRIKKTREEIASHIKTFNGGAEQYSKNPTELYAQCLRDFLKEELIFNNMTQRTLAQEAGVNERTITRIMHCKCEPCRDTLIKLYGALGLTSMQAEANIQHLMQEAIKELAENQKE